MQLLLDDSEIKEIRIEDVLPKSEDRAVITIKGEHLGKRHEGKDDIAKEVIALDAITIGPTEAAKLHGVPQSSASKYANGQDIADDDTRARVLSARHNIADVAVSKLMDTLGMFNPENIEKPIDQIRAAGHLANIVEKMTGSDRNNGNEVHLHLYGPKQKSLEHFTVIDV